MSSLKSCVLMHKFQSNDMRRCIVRTLCCTVPVIDLCKLHGSSVERFGTVTNIGRSCCEKGFFQVVNHGIPQQVLNGALDAAKAFFDLPTEEKVKLMSNDISMPVRFCSVKEMVNGHEQVRRLFLKHYSHPLHDWINMWPSKPLEYREKMGTYSMEVRKMYLQVIEAIIESLGLNRDYLKKEIDEGLQVMAINGYPSCNNLKPNISAGIRPHYDYAIITVLLECSEGLEELDPMTNKWELIPHKQGSLCVHVGNYLEVISNGLYKSAMHRVAMNRNRTRVSIASLHSLAIDEKVCVADELVDEHNPKLYKESSLRDFLMFISNNKCSNEEGYTYIDSLRSKNEAAASREFEQLKIN